MLHDSKSFFSAASPETRTVERSEFERLRKEVHLYSLDFRWGMRANGALQKYLTQTVGSCIVASMPMPNHLICAAWLSMHDDRFPLYAHELGSEMRRWSFPIVSSADTGRATKGMD